MQNNASATTVYGGGDGKSAVVLGGTKVFMKDSSATNVYGGGNSSGATVSGGAQVVLEGSTVSNVYGGGKNAIISGGVRLGIDAASKVNSKAYLGGSASTANVSGDCYAYIEPKLHWWLFVYIYNIKPGAIAGSAYMHYAPKTDFSITNISVWSNPDRGYIFNE